MQIHIVHRMCGRGTSQMGCVGILHDEKNPAPYSIKIFVGMLPTETAEIWLQSQDLVLYS